MAAPPGLSWVTSTGVKLSAAPETFKYGAASDVNIREIAIQLAEIAERLPCRVESALAPLVRAIT